MQSTQIQHVAIIPDGNRRWAKGKGIPEYLAHSNAGSFERFSSFLAAAEKKGIQFLSIWGFSTENWNRSNREVKELLKFIEQCIDSLIDSEGKHNYRYTIIGRRDRLPETMIAKIEELESTTKNEKGMQVILCIDYGGRDELLRAVNKAIKDGKEVDEESFADYLDTNNFPDPELVIRTGGEQRLSGFMPFQTVYSEFIFSDVLFPDFAEEHLEEAITEYKNRKRRFGS